MASDHRIRASDRDRDEVVAALREAYTEGRLTLEEFQERTDAAYRCRTWGELRELTGDLPVQPPLGADIPGRETAVPPGSAMPEQLRPPGAPRSLQTPRPARPGTRGPWSPAVPFVAIWILFALGTRSPDGALAGLIVVGALLLFTSLTRRR
jgi:hypothetical protein